MSSPNDFQRAALPLSGLLKELQEKASHAPTPAPAIPQATCAQCHGFGYAVTRVGHVAYARACTCEFKCSGCDGRGFTLAKRDGYEFRVPCECQSLPMRLATFNAAQLPARFAEKGFDDFYVHEEDPRELVIAKRELMRFAETARPGVTGLGKGLVGAPGRGKTHLLAATLTKLSLGRGIRCRYIEISFLFADKKAAISDPKVRATLDKIDDLAEVDVLAIDELGKGRGSAFEDEILDELIGRRYNTGKLTLFASNYPRVESDAKGGEFASQSLRARVGERVFSRLHEMVEFIELPSKTRDRRLPPIG